MQERLRDQLSHHPRLVAGGAIGAIVLLGITAGLAIGVFGSQPSGEADATPSIQPTRSSQPTGGPSSSPSQTASPAASPASSSTSSSASFNVLPAQQPADFVSGITCGGPIGASDPVAIVQLRAAVEGAYGEIVLRDYADPGNPRTACQLAGNIGIAQLIDARHVVISSGGAYAVVDLPEVRFHWFQLPSEPGVRYASFLAVSPALDEIVWVSSNADGTMREAHLTTASGDQVIASLPFAGGRCGTGFDSKQSGYAQSGSHLYILDQTQPLANVLIVLRGSEQVFSLVPPNGTWPLGAWPYMAAWSPTSETLFYGRGGDVWQWTPAGGSERYLPGVSWYFPTLTPDGGHLAYSVASTGGLHDVYLVDLAHDGSPQLIGEARNLPVFVNSTQLWYKTEGQGVCGPGTDQPLIYNITDGSESPSIIERVLHVWPAASSNF